MKTLPQNGSVTAARQSMAVPDTGRSGGFDWRGWSGWLTLPVLCSALLLGHRPALAQESNVTVYGRVNLGVVHYGGVGPGVSHP